MAEHTINENVLKIFFIGIPFASVRLISQYPTLLSREVKARSSLGRRVGTSLAAGGWCD
jgi:hypothetical protein